MSLATSQKSLTIRASSIEEVCLVSGSRKPINPIFTPPILFDHIGRQIGKYLVCPGIEDVGAEPRKFRFLHPGEQIGGLEIELVVTQNGIIDADGVPGVDHLRALISERFHRGRDRIAAEGKYRVRIVFKCLFLDSYKPGRALPSPRRRPARTGIRRLREGSLRVPERPAPEPAAETNKINNKDIAKYFHFVSLRCVLRYEFIYMKIFCNFREYLIIYMYMYPPLTRRKIF